MVTTIVEAAIEAVLDNPHRDFTNYPIDREQVERLKASFEDTGGIWHALPARRHVKEPYAGWTYQLCFGHHRLVAARELKYETIRLEVGEHDDDEMLLMLATENGTQRVNNAAAGLDSVAAITRRLAYLMLRATDLDHLSGILERCHAEKLFKSQKAFEVAKGSLLKSDGIGSPLILKYAPAGTLERHEVEGAIATLKQTGGYQRIIDYVTERVNSELADEEAERERQAELERQQAEREREKAEKEAEKARIKAEKDAEREHKKAEKAKADAEAAEARRLKAEARKEAEAEAAAQREKEEAEQREKDAAAELDRLEAERVQREREADQRAKERADREAAQKAEREEAEKREAQLLALAIKAAQTDPLLDAAVVPYFRNHYALGRFREIVTDQENRHWFPLAEQLNHVQTIHKLFEKQNRKPAAENLTAKYVGSYLNTYLRECWHGKREDERRLRSLAQSFDAALEKALKGASWIQTAVLDMLQYLEDGAHVPADFEEKLKLLEEKTAEIARLRDATGYVRGGKEIAGKAAASQPRLAISNR